jgi:hypothetical protein
MKYMSQGIPLEELINQFRGEISSAVDTLHQVSSLSRRLPERPVEQLDREFAWISQLLQEVQQTVRRASVQVFEGNERWGNSPFATLTSSRGNSSFVPMSSGSTISSSVPQAIHFTQGGHKEYLERHYWNSQDGEAMQQYRETLTTVEKRLISQIQGESWGHRYVTDILRYEEVFHGDSKSIRQGLDGIYLDPKEDALVVVEFKGQRSLESAAQQRPTWTLDTCQKIQRYQFPYHKVSEFEREAAAIILQQYEAGRTIRYEVIRTEVDPNTGKMWTQLEKQTRLECDLPSP